MHLVADTQDLLDQAHAHLEHAAALASDGFALQVRLAAATLPPLQHHRPVTAPDTPTVHAHLDAALAALDAIDPSDGPADLQLCAWHIHELRRLEQHGLAS